MVVTASAACVPKRWPGGTVACLGCGPSLRQADVDLVRARVDGVIAINNAYELAPWADVLYGCDSKFWHWHRGVPNFKGLRYGLDPRIARMAPGVTVLRNTGEKGLELDPTGLRAGRNSGYQAINLAVHLGAARIILLGYDMRGGHFHRGHPDGSLPPFAICLQRFATLVEPLREAGVEVINCTPRSALTVFPQRRLADVLPAPAAMEAVS